MNFWKILRKLLEEIFPEWQDKFISYKDLKKQLNLMYPMMDSSQNERPNKRPRLSGDDQMDSEKGEKKDFLELLVVEIKKINGFFMDKEEECVIRSRLLRAAVCGAKDSKEELMKVGRKMVNFHGEMILLKNYSALNYIGLLKILKKYDRRSGNQIRMPFIRKLLHEPFFKTEVINNLVNECEAMICCIFSQHEQLPQTENSNGFSDPLVPETEMDNLHGIRNGVPADEHVENVYLRLSRTALRTMRQIRSGSSTISMFSLPPMEDSELSNLD